MVDHQRVELKTEEIEKSLSSIVNQEKKNLSYYMRSDIKIEKFSSKMPKIIKIFKKEKPPVIVITKENVVAGIITKRGLMALADIENFDEIDSKLKEIKNVKIEKVLERPIPIYENENLQNAWKKMSDSKKDILIVLSVQNNVIGIITKGAIIKYILKRRVGPRLETGIDKLLDKLEHVGEMKVELLAKELNVSIELIEEWGRILEEHEFIIVEYPPIGKPSLKIVKK